MAYLVNNDLWHLEMIFCLSQALHFPTNAVAKILFSHLLMTGFGIISKCQGPINFLPPHTRKENKHLKIIGIKSKSSCSASKRFNH